MRSDWLDGVEQVRDANHGDRNGHSIDGVVIHWTAGGDAEKTAHWAAKEHMFRSWHFLVGRDGRVYQQVPLSRAAWHAGHSSWVRADGECHDNANPHTVGIELANWGPVLSVGGDWRVELGGQTYPYRGRRPVWSTLQWDNGDSMDGWWEPYPEKQLQALKGLLGNLADAGVPMHLRGHNEIRMPFGLTGQRPKMDPGPLFPWHRFGRIHADLRCSAAA